MNKTLIANAVVGVFALSGAFSMANASPVLQIITTTGSEAEHAGDPSGSVYPWPGGPGVGAGLPWANTITGAGWPGPYTGNGFSADGSAPGSVSVSGWDASYLYLTEAANVTFQFMGGGNSSLLNHFFVNGAEMFQDSHGSNPTNPCPVTAGATSPSCDIIGVFPDASLRPNQYTVFLPAGLINFQFITGNGVVLDNTGAGLLGNPTDASGLPGYLLAIDPYLATAPYSLSGQAVYAGLADLPRPGDHDYQDMGVRISVAPEPGSLMLLMLGLLGFGALRRRSAASDSKGLLA